MADGDSHEYEKDRYEIDRHETETVLIWDLPVRIFHWALVIAFIGAFVTDKLGVAYFKYHEWCGYTVLVLVAFRLAWGFFGTHHARFTNFVRGPAAIWRYLRGRDRHYAGHNPLGALMVVALLGGLLVQAVTGLFGNDEIFNVGPLYGYIDNELSLRLTSLHRQLFYWIAGAIGIHIVAVIVYRIFKKEKLVVAMWTGRKSAQRIARDEGIEVSRMWLAIAIMLAFTALLTWLVMRAPLAAVDVGY